MRSRQAYGAAEHCYCWTSKAAAQAGTAWRIRLSMEWNTADIRAMPSLNIFTHDPSQESATPKASDGRLNHWGCDRPVAMAREARWCRYRSLLPKECRDLLSLFLPIPKAFTQKLISKISIFNFVASFVPTNGSTINFD